MTKETLQEDLPEVRGLAEIIQEFEDNRISFSQFRKVGELNKHTLLEYQARFVDIKAELRPYKVEMIKEWTRRDDKAATAIKFRIAVAIHQGTFKDENGKLIYETCSITAAEKYASGCDKYKEFVDQRAFYKESMTNVTDLRNDCDSFANLIKDILRTVQ
jgi:hypothetical protein